MSVLKRNIEIMIPEAVTPLPENAFPTPVKDPLPEHLEKLFGKVDMDNADTPKIKKNNIESFQLTPRVLYEEFNQKRTFIDDKKLVTPKFDSLLSSNQFAVSGVRDFDSSLTNQPVVTLLPENAIPTPVTEQLPPEKLIGNADMDDVERIDTPKMMKNDIKTFQLTPIVLYEEVNQKRTIIEDKTLETPKFDSLLSSNQFAVSHVRDFDNSLTIQPAVTLLSENAIPTPVTEQLPLEKLIGKADMDDAVYEDTPEMEQNNITRFKHRPRVLYEEVNKISKIIKGKDSLLSAVSRVYDFDNILINQPVSLKNRRQIYLQLRFSEKRQQRKEFELKRRAMSRNQMVFRFRDIILENILNTEL